MPAPAATAARIATRWLQAPAQRCAILAGVLMTIITPMTWASLIGRSTNGRTIVGDFELSGAAIVVFMPWCQLRTRWVPDGSGRGLAGWARDFFGSHDASRLIPVRHGEAADTG